MSGDWHPARLPLSGHALRMEKLVRISPLLNGIRTLTGEKIQWYLASELRDRIRNNQVRVTVIDKLSRKQYEVEPRQFGGRKASTNG